jgi:hypothetical protein
MSVVRRRLLARFPRDEALVDAARALSRAGFAEVDAHTPYPVEGLAEALRLRPSTMPRWVLIGALVGALVGYLLQWYTNAYDFPLDVGGRPPHGPLAFVPITFECAVLFGAFAAFFGLLARLGLPRLCHPVLGSPRLSGATRDQLWLSLVTDERTPAHTLADGQRALTSLGALEVDLMDDRR